MVLSLYANLFGKVASRKNYRGMEKDLALKAVLCGLCVNSLLGGHGD